MNEIKNSVGHAMTLIRPLQIAIAFSLAMSTATSAQRPDTSAWVADFATLQDEMAAHYSTFQWQVRDRGMNLPQLVATTTAALRAASDESAARAALRQFVAAFGDGHLSISWPSPTTPKPSASAPTPTVCQDLGFDGVPAASGLAFGELAAFQPLGSADNTLFPAGILRLETRRIGIVRIGLFDASAFPALCDSARLAFDIGENGPCDGACENAIDTFTGNLLTAALIRQVERLRAEGIEVLAVDVTGNPGGNDWNEPAARVLTARPLSGSRYGFIRHPHWVATIERKLRTLQSDTDGLSAAELQRIQSAAQQLREALDEVKQPCDLRPLWKGQSVSCSLVVDRPLFVTGLLPYAAPGDLPKRPSSTVLFGPNRYTYREGAYTGPLWVLVDDRSASSAERFAAMLRDNDAAIVIGVPTLGAGCGYTNGGIPVILPRTGARVRMPDCFQFRKDMTSVGDGVTPDVLVPWRNRDTSHQRVTRLLPVLRQVR